MRGVRAPRKACPRAKLPKGGWEKQHRARPRSPVDELIADHSLRYAEEKKKKKKKEEEKTFPFPRQGKGDACRRAGAGGRREAGRKEVPWGLGRGGRGAGRNVGRSSWQEAGRPRGGGRHRRASSGGALGFRRAVGKAARDRERRGNLPLSLPLQCISTRPRGGAKRERAGASPVPASAPASRAAGRPCQRGRRQLPDGDGPGAPGVVGTAGPCVQA